MVSKNPKTNFPRLSEPKSEPEIIAVYQETIENEDELIASLAKMRENKRARQVFDWEITRRNMRFSTLEKQAA